LTTNANARAAPVGTSTVVLVRDVPRIGSPIHIRTHPDRYPPARRACAPSLSGRRRRGASGGGVLRVDIPGHRRRTRRPRCGLRSCAHVVGWLPASSCRVATKGCVRITHQARHLSTRVWSHAYDMHGVEDWRLVWGEAVRAIWCIMVWSAGAQELRGALGAVCSGVWFAVDAGASPPAGIVAGRSTCTGGEGSVGVSLSYLGSSGQVMHVLGRRARLLRLSSPLVGLAIFKHMHLGSDLFTLQIFSIMQIPFKLLSLLNFYGTFDHSSY
jgi:hypothetical protein